MNYCKKCLQPDTRPNTKFTIDGICPACIYSDTIEDVDWDERKNELLKIVESVKSNDNSGYDCIIGVSGGKDSTRQAIYVKEVLHMNPLLVCLGYPPEQITQRGVDNISNLINHGFDCLVINPAPKIWCNLMRKAFLEFGNFGKSTELALFSSVPRCAIMYQIPLIWWGENPGLQLGDMGAMGKDGGDGNRLKHINTLAGGDITWLLSNEIKKNHILQYCYPSDDEMIAANIRIVFLGYYWKDWSLLNNGTYSTLRGLEIRDGHPQDLGEPFGLAALDEDWVIVNQMIKYYKFGFGRTTDYVNEEIRLNRMSRDEGIELVKKFDGNCGLEYINSFCKYIDITLEKFWEVVEKFVNQDIFSKDDNGAWKPRFTVGIGL